MEFWNDPITTIFNSLLKSFTSGGMSEGLATVLIYLIGILLFVTFAMVLDIFLVWIERKVVARFQDRLGPNRLGPFGIFQPFADIVKLLIKEDITPVGADVIMFNLAPIFSMMSVLLLWAIMPFAPKMVGVDLNVAMLYLVAAGSIGTLSVIMAGWASNNKYATMGAFRTVAQMVSYEIPMVAAILVITVLSGTMGVVGIVEAQEFLPFIFYAPLTAIIFLISAIAELGRSPFDLNEAESEIVAGFHTEYTGMKFGLFYAGELLHSFTFGGFIALLFFGGHRFFGLENLGPIVGALIFIGKALFFYWVIMWVKYTVPRIRIDHMLAFNWKFLTPLAFILLMVTALVGRLLLDSVWLVPALFLSNVFVGWMTVLYLKSHERKTREAEDAKSAVPVAQH
ncbi:MAG: NADH-quinone oxidoreductase subunit NuoH [Anaerolineae bacterium]|jgi:NADH-quinone oxidoreductase subunit H|nr:NADH-quinone oxidoreductase subunit NuoH [Anaerolineae bacterium]MBT3713532.1 NADH-quinone oxidoreductase subunit NuoH [Anaerolineae bacterium]MBT4311114.1 NADH-quinone oxidoreductase subunit NuoH [Anaerolineae bacterium]MBT4459375.1 NADH-quinone oxidoreductase subunit NuoH [Anaerolineae bacterium]MBT4841277.1 NADH-quinone oxidoreductase subunit NuoH [Anaerolineae bacterium]